MKQNSDKISYAIYIDRRQAFIFTIGGSLREEILSSEAIGNPAEIAGNTKGDKDQVHLQNEKNEQLRRFCRLIIEHLQNPHKVLIFGPSVSKFELQKEIVETKRLRHIDETLKKSDAMAKEDAERYVREYFGL